MKNTKELVLAKIKETLLQVAPGAKVILFEIGRASCRERV